MRLQKRERPKKKETKKNTWGSLVLFQDKSDNFLFRMCKTKDSFIYSKIKQSLVKPRYSGEDQIVLLKIPVESNK